MGSNNFGVNINVFLSRSCVVLQIFSWHDNRIAQLKDDRVNDLFKSVLWFLSPFITLCFPLSPSMI